MKFRMSKSHLYVTTRDGKKHKMSLDSAERLRVFLTKRLYQKKEVAK